MENKITNFDRFNTIEAVFSGDCGVDADVAQDIVDFCAHQKEMLVTKSAKAKARAAEKKAQGDELTDAVFSVLTTDPQTANDILAQIEGDDVTLGKIRYRLRTLVDNGRAQKVDVVVEGDKKRQVKAYMLA